MKSIRFDIRFPDWLLTEIKSAAKAKGVSTAEYIKDVLKKELVKEKPP